MTNLDRFRRLFRGRETAYGQYLVVQGGKNDVATIRDEAPVEAWERHLKGEKHGLGIVPINLANECYFGAIDLDDKEADHISLGAKVEELGLPLVVCKSKSGGAHFYLFLRDPAPAKMVSEKLRLWAELLGISNVDGRSIEIFPKQARLKPDQVGNWINLPYYGGASHGRVAVGTEGSFLSPAEFLAFAEGRAVTSDELKVWAMDIEDDRFTDAPPCLATLNAIGFGEGGRNNGLYNICVLFKLANPDGWQDDVTRYNLERMTPPLSNSEVETIVGSAGRRDYGYRGMDQPLFPYCCQGSAPHLRAVCGRKKFGCNAGAKASAVAALPPLANLRKLETRPPVYYLEVGDQELKLSPEDLSNFRKFRIQVLIECNTLLPMLKENTWISIIEPLIVAATRIEAPEEASEAGVLRAHLSGFLERRRQSHGREDLLRSLPVEEDSSCIFRAVDLMEYLDRKRFRISTHNLWAALREMGADKSSISVKGATVRIWKIPTPDAQTEEFSSRTDDGPSF